MHPWLRILVTTAALCAALPMPALPGTTVCDRPTTMLVVRHADRQGSDDALSQAGRERARDLARVTSRAGVTAIYCTDTRRSALTAEPTAQARGIAPVVYPGKDADELVRRILDGHCGETVLVVGHSNTVPRIVAAAGGAASADLAEDRYDDLFVVTVFHGGTRVTHPTYGASAK